MKRKSINAGKGLLLAAVCVLCLTGFAMRARAQEQTVRAGVFELKGFTEKGTDGQPYGYGIDYLDRIAEKTGWRYDYVWVESWEEGVELLRKHEIDLIAPSEKTKERENGGDFLFPAYNTGMECGALLTRKTREELVYEDFDSFRNITAGYARGTVFKDAYLQYAKNNGFTPRLKEYGSNEELFEALLAGKVDAILVNLFAKTQDMKILAKFGAAPFYFMLSEGDVWLLSQLNDALEQISIESPTFDSELMKKYYPDYSVVPYTKAELEYIAAAPVFTVGCRSDIRPVSYVDGRTGEVAGITRDILDEISHRSGLKFEYAALPHGNITYDDLRERHISLISSVEYNEENVHAPGIRLTTPYLQSHKVFVCARDTRFDTEAHLKIAVSTGSQTLIPVIGRVYPHFEVINYNSVEECFEAVRKGKADALLQNQYVITSFLARPVYADMMLLPAESLADLLCLSPVLYQEAGISDPLLSDSRLISILDKTIRQLDEKDISKIIISHTTEHQYRYTVRDFAYQYRYVIAVILLILAALMGIIWYAVHVRREGMLLVRKNEERLRNITDNVNGGVVVLTGVRTLHISYANEGFFTLLQYEPAELEKLKEKEYTAFIHPDDRKAAASLLSPAAFQGGRISLKLRMLKKDGGSLPALFNGTLTKNTEGLLEICCVIMDISEQEELLSSLFLEREKYDTLIRNSGEILFEMDCKRGKFSVSPLFEQKFGWKAGNMDCAGDLYDFPHRFRIHKEDSPLMQDAIRQAFVNRENTVCTVRVPDVNESFLWCQISMYPMMDRRGDLAYILGRLLDVDQEICEKRKLEEKSRTDALTGLLNKNAFLEESERYLKGGCAENTAVVFIDVDNFKQVNDSLGHMEGDRAIKETAKKLRQIFSERDLLARFGGDEFCVLIKGIPPETLRERLALAVQKLQAEHTSEGTTVACTVSIGASYARSGGKEGLNRLLQRADKAVYRAKEEGKNRFVLYEEL